MSLRVVIDRMSSRPDMAARALAAVAISLWYSAWLYRKSRRMKVRIRLAGVGLLEKDRVPSIGLEDRLCDLLFGFHFIPLLCLTRGLARQSAVAGMEGFDSLRARRCEVRRRSRSHRPRRPAAPHGMACAASTARACARVTPSRTCTRRSCSSSAAVHQQHPVNGGAEVVLDKQRNDPYLIGTCGGLRAALQLRHDGRVHQSLQRGAVRGPRAKTRSRRARRSSSPAAVSSCAPKWPITRDSRGVPGATSSRAI